TNSDCKHSERIEVGPKSLGIVDLEGVPKVSRLCDKTSNSLPLQNQKMSLQRLGYLRRRKDPRNMQRIPCNLGKLVELKMLQHGSRLLGLGNQVKAVEEALRHSLHTPRKLRRSIRPKRVAIFDRSSLGSSDHDASVSVGLSSFTVLASPSVLLSSCMSLPNIQNKNHVTNSYSGNQMVEDIGTYCNTAQLLNS
ncbi:hypothetical protein RJ641_030956, partial [Dillenia turbinata]